MESIIELLPKLFKRKYLITIIIFAAWVSFFDQNNLIKRYKQIQYLNRLEEDKTYYQQRIKTDASRLNEFIDNKDVVEEYAREEYFMKRSNEDIFVIVKED